MRRDWLKFLALLVPVLTGCLSHTRSLQKPKLAGVALDADAVQLVEAVNLRYDQVTSLSATVDFAASVGGAHKGKQTDYTSIHGYILLRKPQMLRVLGYLPVVRLRAFDLASDGKTFTMLIPPRSRAIQGSNSVTTPGRESDGESAPGHLPGFDPDPQHLPGLDRFPHQLQPDHVGAEDQAADRAAAVRPDGVETRGAKLVARIASTGHAAARHPLQPD